MLRPEMNERLARVGPGTPCGELMRRYWIPIAPVSQLLEDPVRKVRILGENLTLFRDRSGKLGLIGERCLHRAVDLQWGIPDSDGLRCAYHGWLYGADGRCLDTPLEDPNSTFKERLHITAYPVQELGGLVFAYLGPQPAPLLPPWDLFVWPNAVRQMGIAVLNCNWLQCHENTGDPTHAVYLHGHLFNYVLEKMGASERLAEMGDGFTRAGNGIKDLYVHATEYGLEKGVVFSRDLGAERDYVSRHSTVMFPFYTQLNAAGAPWSEFQIRVPIDDTHTCHISYGCYAAPAGVEAPKQESIPWYEVPIWDKNGKPVLDTILNQDFIGWWSQGELTNRSVEKLGRTDLPVLFLRRQLDQQIRIVEDGGEPMNVFRDPAAMPEILFGGGMPSEYWVATDWATRPPLAGRTPNRFSYHKGGAQREADRYGPAIPLVAELHRRIEATREGELVVQGG